MKSPGRYVHFWPLCTLNATLTIYHFAEPCQAEYSYHRRPGASGSSHQIHPRGCRRGDDPSPAVIDLGRNLLRVGKRGRIFPFSLFCVLVLPLDRLFRHPFGRGILYHLDSAAGNTVAGQCTPILDFAPVQRHLLEGFQRKKTPTTVRQVHAAACFLRGKDRATDMPKSRAVNAA